MVNGARINFAINLKTAGRWIYFRVGCSQLDVFARFGFDAQIVAVSA